MSLVRSFFSSFQNDSGACPIYGHSGAAKYKVPSAAAIAAHEEAEQR
jgi:hypothetical protein